MQGLPDCGPLTVRPLQERELAPALSLVWEIFCRDNAPFYTAQGVETFRGFLLLSSILGQVQSGSMRFWGLYAGDRLAGACALRLPDHVSLLFVDAPYRRRGAALSLMRAMQGDCLARGVGTVTVNADLGAVDFYRAAGFYAVQAAHNRDGIRFLPMALPLKPKHSGEK